MNQFNDYRSDEDWKPKKWVIGLLVLIVFMMVILAHYLKHTDTLESFNVTPIAGDRG